MASEFSGEQVLKDVFSEDGSDVDQEEDLSEKEDFEEYESTHDTTDDESGFQLALESSNGERESDPEQSHLQGPSSADERHESDIQNSPMSVTAGSKRGRGRPRKIQISGHAAAVAALRRSPRHTKNNVSQRPRPLDLQGASGSSTGSGAVPKGRGRGRKKQAAISLSSPTGRSPSPTYQTPPRRSPSPPSSPPSSSASSPTRRSPSPISLLSRDEKIHWLRNPYTSATSPTAMHTSRSTSPIPPSPPPQGPEGPGPTEHAVQNVHDILSAFRLFITPEMEDIIVTETNREGIRKFGADVWKPIDSIDLQAYIGLLILAGVYKSRGEAALSLWASETGRSIFRATMPLKKFYAFSRTLRFDDRATRDVRRASDKLAAVRQVWDLFVAQLPQMYTPGSSITVDEQLVPFRGRCPFRMYMPMKPARYGIKIWVACDSKSSYAWNMQVYTGKQLSTSDDESDVPEQQDPMDTQADQRPQEKRGKKKRKSNNTNEAATTQGRNKKSKKRPNNLAMKVVLDLTASLGGDRSVTTDNYFTTYELARKLQERGLSLVGTVRKDKPWLPKSGFSASRAPRGRRAQPARPLNSCDYVYCPLPGVLASFQTKKNRSVLLFSTRRRHIIEADRCRAQCEDAGEPANVRAAVAKPPIVIYYNKTKGGVDTLDKVVGAYSVRRMTRRWPLAIFHNMIDVASYNSFVVYREMKPRWLPERRNKRRVYLEELGKALVAPLIERRSHLPRNKAAQDMVQTFRNRAAVARGASLLQDRAAGSGRGRGESSQDPSQGAGVITKRKRCQACRQDRKTTTVCANCNIFICGACTVCHCRHCTHSMSNTAVAEAPDENDDSDVQFENMDG